MSTRLIGELFLNGRVFQVSFGQSSEGAKARSIHLAGWLPACEADDGGADAFHAWEIRRFERRRVGDGRVDRADAADRGVEQAEQVFGDMGRDLGADPPRSLSSWTISTRLVRVTESVRVSRSSGRSVRRSITSFDEG